ncbi:MAG: DegV family EDD domain-containing protein [Candidatus Marinimicrobia bacterium]|nr:DegV family EDD domain-containing protein [Candidatus Neomarinimicrobiota bacterium]MCF7921143.1 DegV family EDD domain-containing protein [Candidatus Neomarinimicrobiota bacterium]
MSEIAVRQGVKYIDGYRFRAAFIAGAQAIINDRAYLNKINVFPVADADTGTNLASTVQAVAAELPNDPSLGKVISEASDAALMGSRGNSGIIFAQFLYGLSLSLKSEKLTTPAKFVEAARVSVEHVYESLLNPVEGTILTVMRAWSNALKKFSSTSDDFQIILHNAYEVAEKALKETPRQLEVLAKAGVVDSGAKGFVDFLQGITEFIRAGNLRDIPVFEKPEENAEIHQFSGDDKIPYRYCTEALISHSKVDFVEVKHKAESFGDSVVVAGSPQRLRLHVHTNDPAELFDWLREQGELDSMKAEDMVRQYEVSHKRKYPIALVTDSACDLPQEIIEKYQINVIPFTVNFGENSYLDKVTITPEKFYSLLDAAPIHPSTAQPSPAMVSNLLSFLKTHYDSVMSVHISSQLSGIHNLAVQAVDNHEGDDIHVIDSKQLSVSQGLIVYRLAQAIDAGKNITELKALAQSYVEKTKVFVDVATLKYMVRGGRVSPLKGLVAKLLNLKPIISLDEDGKGVAYGKSFSRQGNMEKIKQMTVDFAEKGPIWNYAIVHARALDRAEVYAADLEKLLGKAPAYIQEISPVVGAHNGIGVVGIGIMHE